MNNQNKPTKPEVKTVLKAVNATIQSSSKDASYKKLSDWNEFLTAETEKDALEIVELRKEIKVAVEALEKIMYTPGVAYQIAKKALEQIKTKE